MAVLLYIILSVIIGDSFVTCFRLNVVSDIVSNSITNDINSTTAPYKKVCIIGAGISGLSAARYLKEEGINFTVFEATRYVGGTWRYEPRVGTDENGLPIHTSMYKHLRTNEPNPNMELGGFRFPDDTPSFPSWDIYYEYLQAYAKNFDIEKHIKFFHKVVLVRREGNIWKVKHEHVQTKEIFEEEYNYVIVGNGRYSKPNMPDIAGEDLFNGTIIHSHDYRVPDPYKGRRVLVVGGGPSGFDISVDVANVSTRLVHSHHTSGLRTPFPSHYIRKPDVKEFNETGVIFVDGTYEEVDDVIYCTGYQLDFPFLDETSGLEITPKRIRPLYKNMVNINQPSMIIMGFTSSAIFIDLQARYATALIKGNFTLPPKLRETFFYWSLSGFYDGLAEESGVKRVPPVVYDLRLANGMAYLENLYTFRDYVYSIIDDKTFKRTLKTKLESVQPPIELNKLVLDFFLNLLTS